MSTESTAAAASAAPVRKGRKAQQDPATPDQGGAVAVGTETWYTQPWVWIVLGVALLVVLLTLMSRGRRTRT